MMTLEVAIRTVLGAAAEHMYTLAQPGDKSEAEYVNEALVLVRQLVAPWVVPEDE